MPDLDGPQTLAGLQRLSPQIRCCFLSADFGSYTEDELRTTVLTGGKPARPFQGAVQLAGWPKQQDYPGTPRMPAAPNP
jgi:hypothetical protein